MKKEQLNYLAMISEAIVSNKYLEEILKLIVSMTAQLMGSKICSIMLLDENKNELVIAASQSLSADYRNKPNIKVGQSVSGQALIKKEPVIVKDVRNHADYMYPQIALKEGIVSMLAVPMKMKEQVIGIINSYTDKPHQFTSQEISILQAVANQAAAAIENTRLRNEVLTAKKELEDRKKIEKAKGLLMQQLNIGEKEAYDMIRKKAMNSRKTMVEIAEALILASEMK
ncbi:MAG: GAF domain-containing protein [Elusimicrobiota bacterium]